MNYSKFERYEAYKDSGIDWLDEVPEHWGIKRVKELSMTISKGTTPSTEGFIFTDTGVRFIKAENISYTKSVSKNPTFYIGVEAHAALYRSQLKPNDLLIVIAGATIGKVGIVVDDLLPANTNQAVCFVRFGTYNNIDLLYYLFSSDYFSKYIWYSIVQSAQPNLSMGVLGDFILFIPPMVEQQAIAAYLDTKTTQIDRKIDILSQKAIQYGKLKQSFINETVTRGLDKTVAMKDSGVGWIGEVPVHWEVQRIGTAFEERSEKVNDTDYPPLSVSMGGIVPQMASVAKTDNNDNRKRVAVGDYVINSRSDRRGSSGISIYDGSVAVISIVLEPKRSFFGKYLHHLFRSYRFIEEFYRVGRGIVDDLWTTRYSIMKAIEFAYPSYEEQKAIANYLDDKTTQIDRIVGTINTQVDNLKELRKTLINDVVTGKIKVAKEG